MLVGCGKLGSGLGSWVQGLGFRVQGLGLRSWGLGFKVEKVEGTCRTSRPSAAETARKQPLASTAQACGVGFRV